MKKYIMATALALVLGTAALTSAQAFKIPGNSPGPYAPPSTGNGMMVPGDLGLGRAVNPQIFYRVQNEFFQGLINQGLTVPNKLSITELNRLGWSKQDEVNKYVSDRIALIRLEESIINKFIVDLMAKDPSFQNLEAMGPSIGLGGDTGGPAARMKWCAFGLNPPPCLRLGFYVDKN
jgi:hypothetical protein